MIVFLSLFFSNIVWTLSVKLEQTNPGVSILSSLYIGSNWAFKSSPPLNSFFSNVRTNFNPSGNTEPLKPSLIFSLLCFYPFLRMTKHIGLRKDLLSFMAMAEANLYFHRSTLTRAIKPTLIEAGKAVWGHIRRRFHAESFESLPCSKVITSAPLTLKGITKSSMREYFGSDLLYIHFKRNLNVQRWHLDRCFFNHDSIWSRWEHVL